MRPIWRRDLIPRLQFPSNEQHTDGVLMGLSELTLNTSPVMSSAFYRGLTASKKYSLYTLNNLLKCFRYFKELRNCYMHRGRTCDNRLYGAQSQFIPVACEASLGMDFVPKYVRVDIGD